MAWAVCLSAGLFFLYEFFQLNVFDVINQPLRDEFHIDAAELSWMSSAYLWADLLFLIPAGVLLDKYSTRLIILLAMGLCVVSTIGFALTTSYFFAVLFHFLSCIGNAFCFLSCVVLVSRWFPPRRQALVIGCLVTMAFVGGMMAHTPLAYLNAQYGWRNSLLIDGAMGLVIFGWIALFVKDNPNEWISSARESSSSQLRQALMNPQNWLAGLYTSCLNLPIMVLCALWGASYLQVVHQLPHLAASTVISFIFLGSIIGCPLVGWISDRQGRRKPLMMVGAFGTCVVVVPFFLGAVLSEPVLSALFFMLGLLTSTQIITYPLIAESNRLSETGASTGMASLIIMGGGGVGQVLFGWLMQHHAGVSAQQYGVADYQFALWIFPSAALLALLAVLLTKETFCRRSKE